MKEKILLVDDEINILRAYRRTLKGRFTIDTACGAREAIQLIETKGPYAVIVSDMSMPDVNGLELLQHVKDIAPQSIRIMLTGNSEQQVAMDAVNDGKIFKFLLKPCPKEILIESLSLAVEEYRNCLAEKNKLQEAIEHAVNLSHKLSHNSNHDALTGLINRNEFDRLVKEVLEEKNINERNYILLVIDVDQLNIVNQACGRPAGDVLLQHITTHLKKCTRQQDVIARLGADEFGVLLRYCSSQDAFNVAQKMRKSLASQAFKWGEEIFNMTISIGLTALEQNDTDDALHIAEQACNIAKEQGGNRIHQHSSDDGEIAKRRHSVLWVAKINKALKENRFSLYFQPIAPIERTVNMNAHYEILLRMLDEAGQIIAPSIFLPVAERYKLMINIDRWVINAVFAWLCKNPGHVKQLRQCGINLSGQTLGDEETLQFIHDKFEETGISPEKIYFEITESAAIGNMQTAAGFINSLHRLGCRFALDDFGSGLSSFGYLKELPVDYLKIDGMFVKEIHKDPVDYAVVKSITDIGHVMCKQVIAEFVEDDNILKKLGQIGVDYAQGYGVCPPRPVDELSDIDIQGNELKRRT